MTLLLKLCLPLAGIALLFLARKVFPDRSPPRVARYSRGHRAIFWILAAGIAVFCQYLVWAGDEDELSWLGPVFLVFFLAVTHLESSVEVRWDDDFVYASSPYRRNRTIPWGEVLSLTDSTWMSSYRLRTERQGSVWVGHGWQGVKQLLEEAPILMECARDGASDESADE